MESGDKLSILEAIIGLTEYAVVITTAELDPPGPAFVYVNDAFERMTGYTRHEVLGATPRMLQGEATERSVLERLKANLRAGDSFEGCTWNYHKDGTPYQVEWTITPLRPEGEGIEYFFSVQREVSERHPPQERLATQTRRLSAILNAAGTNHDPVTGALNHRGMLLRLQRLIDEAEAAHSVTGIVSLHFRRLDRVDQAFGIEALNQLLNDIGERLDSRLEANESLARSHEHTFAILISAATDVADDADRHLMARAHALVAAVTEAGFEVAGDTLQVQVYAGVARAPPDSRDAQELVLRAEEVTQRGANSDTELVRWADHTIKPAQRQQIKFESKLQRAVTERELVLHYQPIVDLASGEVVGAEALARWPQPDGQAPIGPDHFIPLAEELGLMGRLGTQVFEDACRQLHRWQAHPGNAAFWVSVNVAPAQLRDPDIADHFSAIAREVGVLPAHVKLEITESALEHGLDEVIHAIDALAAAGFPLALDDFGTGYSSLRRLIDMPFSIIKVDRSFVSQTPDGRGAGVVASLSQLSSHLHIHALGEGVETAVHVAFLRSHNYRFAQGYYYAKPMGAPDFATWSGWPPD